MDKVDMELNTSILTENSVFATITGSRLYNLHTFESDYDYTILEYTEKTKSTHKIIDSVDLRYIDLYTFLRQLKTKPSHNDLSVLYSLKKFYGKQSDKISILESFTPNTRLVREVFYRTGKAQLDNPEFKRLRLAPYLAKNFNDFLKFGKYNPTLNAREVDLVNTQTRLLESLPDFESRLTYYDEIFYNIEAF